MKPDWTKITAALTLLAVAQLFIGLPLNHNSQVNFERFFFIIIILYYLLLQFQSYFSDRGVGARWRLGVESFEVENFKSSTNIKYPSLLHLYLMLAIFLILQNIQFYIEYARISCRSEVSSDVR